MAKQNLGKHLHYRGENGDKTDGDSAVVKMVNCSPFSSLIARMDKIVKKIYDEMANNLCAGEDGEIFFVI